MPQLTSDCFVGDTATDRSRWFSTVHLYQDIIDWDSMSRVAQSVECLTTGWTTGRSLFDPRQGQGMFPLASVSRPALGPACPASCIIGTVGPFPRG
jgi:hypothetical protein